MAKPTLQARRYTVTTSTVTTVIDPVATAAKIAQLREAMVAAFMSGKDVEANKLRLDMEKAKAQEYASKQESERVLRDAWASKLSELLSEQVDVPDGFKVTFTYTGGDAPSTSYSIRADVLSAQINNLVGTLMAEKPSTLSGFQWDSETDTVVVNPGTGEGSNRPHADFVKGYQLNGTGETISLSKVFSRIATPEEFATWQKLPDVTAGDKQRRNKHMVDFITERGWKRRTA